MEALYGITTLFDALDVRRLSACKRQRPLKHVVYSRPLEAIVAATFRGRLALTYVLMQKAVQCVRRLCVLFRHGYLVKRPLFSVVSIFKCSEGCVKNAIFTFADVLDF